MANEHQANGAAQSRTAKVRTIRGVKANAERRRKADLEDLAWRLLRGQSPFIRATKKRRGTPAPWPLRHLIIRRPEGYGKSSLVGMLAQKHKVVFCSKSNDQLEEQEQGFKERWPNLRIQRFVSKARHLSDVVLALSGTRFEVSYYENASPYASPTIDVPKTVERLATHLGNAGCHADASTVFRSAYEDYLAPEICGRDLDVILLPIAAFQARCAGFRETWWEHLGLYSTTRRFDDRFGEEREWRRCLRRVLVVIDDPDKEDFDQYRAMDPDDAMEVAGRRSVKRRKGRKTVEYWMSRGFTKTIALDLATASERQVPIHTVRTFGTGVAFEERQPRSTLGYGFWRNTRGAHPTMVVLTTERITSLYAESTLQRVERWEHERRELRRPRRTISPESLGLDLVATPDDLPEPSTRITYHTAVSDEVGATEIAHVTLRYTPLVRRKFHAVLIPIVEKLRIEFPDEHVELIASGLGAKWNLSSIRGVNTLQESTTIIKLSALHPAVSASLLVHFSDIESKYAIVQQLVADQANQAIGRNQGNRFRGRPAIVLCDPRLMGIERLIRYQLTPWSSKMGVEFITQYSGDAPSPIERRLFELLHEGILFGLSDEALRLVSSLPEAQQRAFAGWRKRFQT